MTAEPAPVQVEIPIPKQTGRMSLGEARAMRDLLEGQLSADKPILANEVTQVALNFNGAYTTYRRIRPQFRGQKRTLDKLHHVSCLITALELKGVRHAGH